MRQLEEVAPTLLERILGEVKDMDAEEFMQFIHDGADYFWWIPPSQDLATESEQPRNQEWFGRLLTAILGLPEEKTRP